MGAFCSNLLGFSNKLLELCILQRFVRILFELLVQPRVLELLHFESIFKDSVRKRR